MHPGAFIISIKVSRKHQIISIRGADDLNPVQLRADLKRFSVRFYDDGFTRLEDPITGETGVINDSLAWLIKPKKMDLFYLRRDGVFSFKTPGSSLWGIISKDDKVLVPPTFEIGAVLKNDYATLMKRLDKERNVVIRKNTGRVLRELPDYSDISSCHNGYVIVRSVKNNKFGVIDSRGNITIPCMYSDITETSTRLFIATESGTSFILDEKGKKLSPGFKKIRPPSDEIVLVSDGEPWDIDLFDLKSNHLIPTKIKFLDLREHHEGMTIVVSNFMLGNLWKLIDRNGKIVFESPWVDSLEFANEGLVLLNENGRNRNELDCSKDRWGYLDFKGRVFIKPIYTDARKFVSGFAAVSTGSKS